MSFSVSIFGLSSGKKTQSWLMERLLMLSTWTTDFQATEFRLFAGVHGIAGVFSNVDIW